jgi:hypothetical protein
MDLYRQMIFHPHAESLGADSGKIPAPSDFAQADQSWPWALSTASALRPAFGPVSFEPNLNRRAIDEGLGALETGAGVTVVQHSGAVFFRLVEIPPLNQRTAREPFVAPFF